MNTALLVLRLVPGLLLMGHGLQKLVPPTYSPALLKAMGPRATAAGFDQLGLRPALASVVVAALAELGGGFLIAAGLVTPLGTALIAAVMTTAILSVHIRNGIWNSDGGIEFPFVLLTMTFLVSALGPGSFSIDAWAGIGNWTGVHWAASDVARAGAAVGIGAAAGLLTSASAYVRKMWDAQRHAPPRRSDPEHFRVAPPSDGATRDARDVEARSHVATDHSHCPLLMQAWGEPSELLVA